MERTRYEAASMGGPGLDGYAYQADVYCVDCGRAILELMDTGGKLADPDSSAFSDTERQPQPIFFGEADTAQHCADCGSYLYGPQGEEA